MILAGLAGDIVLVLNIAVVVVGLYAFIHAALQRSDAYTATEKLTKPVWLVILGVSILLAACARRNLRRGDLRLRRRYLSGRCSTEIT